MLALNPGESLLAGLFHDFLARLIRARRRVLVAAAGGSAAVREPAPGKRPHGREDLPLAPEAHVQQEFLELFKHQELAVARHRGVLAVQAGREVQYLMAALTDEVFLNLDWPGAVAWGKQLLEERLFGSHVAGERVFERIDELLQRRDPLTRELAETYLLALGAGFEGRFRRTDATAVLKDYRLRLFEFIGGDFPDYGARDWRLVPSAYANVREVRAEQFVASPHLWMWPPLIALALLLLASTIVWESVRLPLSRQARELLELLDGAGPRGGGALPP
jgi:type VI secretion system protein ImpK